MLRGKTITSAYYYVALSLQITELVVIAYEERLNAGNNDICRKK